MTHSDSSSRQGWFGPISGLLFFAAVVGSAAVFGGFDFFGGVEVNPQNSPGVLLAAIRSREDVLLQSSLIMLVGIGFLGFFIADLRVRTRDAGIGWPSEAFLVGGVLIAAAWLVYLALQLAAHVVSDYGHTDSVQMAIDLLWLAFWLFLPGVLVSGVAAAAVGLRSSFHPIWLGVFGVLVAVSALLPWDGLFVFVAWVAAASVLQLVRNIRKLRHA